MLVAQHKCGKDTMILPPIPTNMTQWEHLFVTDIAPSLGVLTSSGIGFGPIPAILHCRRTGSLGEVNPDPFPFLLGNAIGWIIYAAATTNYYIFAANVRLCFGSALRLYANVRVFI